jgi:hypothetical protein
LALLPVIPNEDFSSFTILAVAALLRRKFWPVFTHQGSAVRVATYDFVVISKLAGP